MDTISTRTWVQRLVAIALAAAGLVLGSLVTAAPGPDLAPAVPPPAAWSARAFTGPVRVVDGDTLVVGGLRIRLEGIDAPETGQTCHRKVFGSWACGTAATAAMAKLVEGHEVVCEPSGLDKYGRTLATCYAGQVDVGAALVRQGLAWAFVRYSKRYVGEEAAARSEKIGVWQGEAQAPWDFRASKWQVSAVAAPQGCAIKGAVTRNGRIYHMPWSPWYDRVHIDPDPARRGDRRWFCSEEEAIAAGWRPALMR